MTRDDTRCERFAQDLSGPSLATLVGIASIIALVAMPMPAKGVQLPGRTLIQQSPGPYQDALESAGTSGLPCLDESKPDGFMEFGESLTPVRGRVKELSRVAEAVAMTKQLQQELDSLRDENRKLRAEIDAVRVERGDLEAAKQAAKAHAAELANTVEQATAQAREMNQKLVAVALRWRNAQLNASLAQAGTLQRAKLDKARVGTDLARMRGELDQVAAAAQECAQVDRRVAALANERDDLRLRLADATARLGWSEAVKAQLENDLAKLRETRATAPHDSGQNRIAIESPSEAVGATGLADGPLESNPVLRAELGMPSAREQANDERHTGAASVESLATVAAPSQGPETASAVADIQRIKTASAIRRGDGEHARTGQRGILGGVPADDMLAELSLEKRLHVQALLADLHSKLDERGLMTTVPGELLFELNSDEVQLGAYETLVKVAELIEMYEDRQVIIVGHSDAVGDAAYNEQLSERRAELFEQFLVENFGIAADRLSTEGLGEARPIASNATPQGRRANRRVEVLILN